MTSQPVAQSIRNLQFHVADTISEMGTVMLYIIYRILTVRSFVTIFKS